MELRVLIVAEHASAKFGGEAALPLHYYRVLRQRGILTWLVVHERTRTELQALFPGDRQIAYIADTIWHQVLWRISQRLPQRFEHFTVGFIMRLLTQLAQRRKVRQIAQQVGITVIHQPAPVSPKEPSMIFGMDVPVIIGPMNGGIDYPPAFRPMQNPLVNLTLTIGRKLANWINWLIPGKRQAALLLVANKRTQQALPEAVCPHVLEIVENGVDLSLWQPLPSQSAQLRSPFTHSANHSPNHSTNHSPNHSANHSLTRYLFIGRLVDWKAVDLLLIAFKQAIATSTIELTVIGDGVERQALEQQARQLDLLADQPHQPGKVYFSGWLSQSDCAAQLQQSDALVLPSLMECGGAVVLEAMAMAVPVIATNWGGPTEYLDPTCGILVDPSSRADFIEGLTTAMTHLARSPQVRQAMGQAGREKVRQQFDWDAKIDRMIDLYHQVMNDEQIADIEVRSALALNQ